MGLVNEADYVAPEKVRENLPGLLDFPSGFLSEFEDPQDLDYVHIDRVRTVWRPSTCNQAVGTGVLVGDCVEWQVMYASLAFESGWFAHDRAFQSAAIGFGAK